MAGAFIQTENYIYSLTKSPKYDKTDSICHQCQIPIKHDCMIMIEDCGNKLFWHQDCFKCESCSLNMAFQKTCLFKDKSTLYCQEDYIKSLDFSCRNCGKVINLDDYAMKYEDYFYHEQCFACKTCQYKPHLGEIFYCLNGDLFCPDHSGFESQITPNLSENTSHNYIQQLEELSHEGEINNNFRPGHLPNNLNQSQNGRRSRSQRNRSARVRTVLTEIQLEALNNYYEANPRPDSVMKERLVELTGLNPRVIRVWFQNRRCKEKKAQNTLFEEAQQTQFFHGNWHPHFSSMGNGRFSDI